jgi:SAM-dependent methyltransferase
MHPISEALGRHYSERFALHGPSSEGVDWGSDMSRVILRFDKMLSVVDRGEGKKPSLLDAGCGYGGLLDYAVSRDIELDYTGIDVASNMTEWARANLRSGKFVDGDILDYEFDGLFDYVVCNGILTQKLDTEGLEMDQFAEKLIRRMFSLCTIGIAFNIMSTHVNYFSDNLYYRNPAKLLSWCLTQISPDVKLDHSYGLYEYTVYIYRRPA